MSVYGKNPDIWMVVIPKPELLNMWYRIEGKKRFKRCPRLNLVTSTLYLEVLHSPNVESMFDMG